MARSTLIRKLAEFAAEGEASSPETYALYFLNWISAAMSGAHENAADILAEFMAQEGTGNYQPLGRKKTCVPRIALRSIVSVLQSRHMMISILKQQPIPAVLSLPPFAQ